MVPKWIFSLPNTSRLQVTPVVVERRHVCDERERVLRARRGHGPRNLALSPSANQGSRRQRRGRHQPRRGRRGRPRLHGHRSRARHRAQSIHRRAAVGNRDGRLAPELQRDRRAARRRQSRRDRDVRRRRRRARFRRRLRSGHRQGSLALLDRAASRRTEVRDLAGQRHRAPGRDDVADRHLRSAARHGLLADRQSVARPDRRRSRRRQPLFGFGRRARCENRQTEMALPVHAARCVGLRRAGNAGARRRDVAGPAAQAPRAGQPQRILLRARSHRRHVPDGQAVREER